MEDLATRSYWLGLDEYEPRPPLHGDKEVDIAIVGGGPGIAERNCELPRC
jgi:uracil-DNA glycosylase